MRLKPTGVFVEPTPLPRLITVSVLLDLKCRTQWVKRPSFSGLGQKFFMGGVYFVEMAIIRHLMALKMGI